MRPCYVYQVWAERLGLVYVGIADDFRHRWQAHLRQSWWLGEVVVEDVFINVMPNREAARMLEAWIIHEDAPRYNTSDEAGSYYRAARAYDLGEGELSGLEAFPSLGFFLYDPRTELAEWLAEVRPLRPEVADALIDLQRRAAA